MDTDRFLSQAFLEAHPRDAALILGRLGAEEAAALVEETPAEIAARVVREMDPVSACACLSRLTPERAAALLAPLPLDRAAGLLRRMEAPLRERLLELAQSDVSLPLRRLLQYPQGTAGALMDPRALALPQDLAASEALTRVRRSARNVLYYLYVVDREQRLVGALNLRELMLAKPRAPLSSVMRPHVARISARADLASIVAHPAWRDFHALPVTEDSGLFLGVIRYETLRRLEEESAPAGSADPTLSTMLSLGELCWIGFAGMLAGLAATFFPQVMQEEKETEDGSRR